ncbi:unnamed protein product [Auanema sp. JU1783]|nr:unnamed protein product [Auanema sp. JU1783]
MFNQLLYISACLLALVTSFRLQGVAVKGITYCGNITLRNTKIKLYDIDTNPGDADDLLDEKYTDKDGEFRVDGTTREFTDIDPVLYIYHDCNDGIRPCQKRWTYIIPKSFIHHGKASKWYDLGKINLNTTHPNEDRSCNH